ncbi:hypothetical protein ACFQY7_32835 [Actinomadura luteofluorescens]
MTGALTVPEDPEAWANCLEDLAYSPERRQKSGGRPVNGSRRNEPGAP